MSFAMAGLRAEQPLTVLDCANVDTSFPGFAAQAAAAGLAIAVAPGAGVPA
jgi:3-phosphoshikimate 1-carboxyvinyltransferase